MKKILLPGMVLLSFCAISQNQKLKPKPAAVVDAAELLKSKFAFIESENSQTKMRAAELPALDNTEAKTSGVASPTIQWSFLASSMNIYGMLVSSGRPLGYNDNLNAVSFIHRRGNSSGTCTPVNNSGAIIARITTNWGATVWDSTCIWSNGTQLARYPQGGIYNPPGNTNISNAYVVGMGPVTDGASWIGNWYASKQLGAGNYNYTASSTPNAQQFIANTPPFQNNMMKHDFSRYSFSATDDGAVRSLAVRYFSVAAGQPTDVRGAAIIKGTFNAGTFGWTMDSIIPNNVLRTNGTKQLWEQPIMAWNEQGTIGYVVFIGAAANASLSNRGWQPIIYKTTNSGLSWSQISGIDFNNIAIKPIKDHIATVNTNTNLEIPFFNVGEGYDAVVDASGKLHIASTIVGTARQHDDSLGYTYRFGTDQYSWAHTPGERPYLYDFVGDGSGAWNYVLVDSLSSEGPGTRTGDPGYAENPWDADPGNSNNKVGSDSRIQLSRTPDGNYVIFTWAESDTNFTIGAKKWNVLPNIKARALYAPWQCVSPTEINITKPQTGTNPNIVNRAMFHYVSGKSQGISIANNSLVVRVPLTVSNSNPYSQLTENRHWFGNAALDFANMTPLCAVGISENSPAAINPMSIYPNPATSQITIAYQSDQVQIAEIRLFNALGTLVKLEKMSAGAGTNTSQLNIAELPAGVYLVKCKTRSSEHVRKIIKE